MMRKEVEQSHSVPIGDLLAGNRYAEAGLIARGVVRQRQPSPEATLMERIDDLLMSPCRASSSWPCLF